MYIVVTYDIRKNRRRRRIRKILAGLLSHVQKSVFEGEIADAAFRRLLDRATEEMDRSEDNLRIYRICERCRAATTVEGVGIRVEEEEDDVIL